MSPTDYGRNMFSQHLFAHKYDIDDILLALCGTSPVVMDTRSGLIATSPSADIPPGNAFPLEPLPASFLTELATSPERKHLSPEETATLESWLQTATISSLPQYFPQGRTGGWLRERVKEAPLDWLDSHDLIPPSMRHINRKKITATSTSRSISIESPDL